MPIKRFMVEVEDELKGLPVLGKLHKGAPKEKRTNAAGKEYEVVGRDLDYFRVEFGEEYKHLNDAWVKLYGAKPRKLDNVILNADSLADAVDFWKEEWTATIMLKRCDEEKQRIWYDKISGRYEHTPRACAMPKCGCKQILRVNMVMPEFIAETGVLGYITLQSTSEEDLRTLIKRLTAVSATYGTLRGIPFSFYRVQRQTSAPKTDKDGKRTGERMSVKRWMVDVQVNPDFTRQHLLDAMTVAKPRALPAPMVTATLPDISTSDARSLLGAGNNRRLGVVEKPAIATTAEPVPPTQPAQPQESSKPADHWTLNNERIVNFLKFALSRLKMLEPDVLDAMNMLLTQNGNPPIQHISEWVYDEVRAVAALVVVKCSYDHTAIELMTSSSAVFTSPDFAISVYEAACEIAESAQPEALEDGEFTDAPELAGD